MSEPMYDVCAQPDCWHFVEVNSAAQSWPAEAGPVAEYVHLDDGEKEHDHDAVPSGRPAALEVWRARYAELFVEHSDGKIGPNSERFIAPGGPRP